MWYYEEDGKQAGPVGGEALQNLVRSRRILPSTRVWRAGMTDWLSADRTELASAFAGPMPPFLHADSGASDYRYAGFWIRLVAYIVDTILNYILLLVPLTIFGVIVIEAGVPTNDAKVGLAVDMIALVGTVLYYMISMASAWQATPGKKLLGLHIVRTDGQKIGLGLALGRYLAYFPSSLVLGIGFLMIAWSGEKKGLHDVLCGTRVVHGKPRSRNLSIVFE